MAEPFCRAEPPTDAARAFVAAVKHGKADRLDELLSADEQLRRQIDEPWFAFDQPAIVAASSNRSLVDVLLDHGADINVRSQWPAGGFGVLDGADPEAAAYLISRGATVDAHAAAALGDLERLRQLIESDAELVHVRGGDGQRPLHFARDTKVIDYLLERGADLEARDIDHAATAAQYAVGQDMDTCRYLIDRGAVVDIFMACALGDPDLVRSVIAREPGCVNTTVGACPHTEVSKQGDGHIYM